MSGGVNNKMNSFSIYMRGGVLNGINIVTYLSGGV